ncbi:SCO family protein [Marinimicrobium sp. ARAG 43.8]|uniref:SCO family protein n=1 Tax=Marinimicrobium sp. ARAG 43.8 TaxID=3418719 RepID=UPI003CEC96E5
MTDDSNDHGKNDNAGDRQEVQRRGVRRTVAVLVVAVLVVMGLQVYKVTRDPPLDREALREAGTMVFEQPRRISAFELVDHRGQPFTQNNLQEHWTLAFFGFTHCPDICPMAMADLSRMMEQLPPALAKQTQVLLVTLDPARDTPEVLAEYVPYFHDDFIGVTGEFLTIKRFANQVNVAFAKVTQGNDYTVDHSGHVVLFNPRGDYHAFFRPPLDPVKLGEHYQTIVNAFTF